MPIDLRSLRPPAATGKGQLAPGPYQGVGKGWGAWSSADWSGYDGNDSWDDWSSDSFDWDSIFNWFSAQSSSWGKAGVKAAGKFGAKGDGKSVGKSDKGKGGKKGKRESLVDVGEQEGKEELVVRVKKCQKDDELKTKWWSYCECIGNGIRDPNRHDETFLRAFFLSVKNNEIPEYQGPGDESNKIFVGGLPRTATKEAVMSMFSVYGEVTHIDMKMDYDGSFRGFCFVSFKETATAELVLQNKANVVFEGRWVECKPAQRPGPPDHERDRALAAAKGYNKGRKGITPVAETPPATAAAAAAASNALSLWNGATAARAGSSVPGSMGSGADLTTIALNQLATTGITQSAGGTDLATLTALSQVAGGNMSANAGNANLAAFAALSHLANGANPAASAPAAIGVNPAAGATADVSANPVASPVAGDAGLASLAALTHLTNAGMSVEAALAMLTAAGAAPPTVSLTPSV